jgi:uncharacterized protein with HEPN domain
MDLETKKSLHDIARAAREIQEFTAGMEFPEFQARRVVQAAVERKFEIIGEALNRLKRTNPPVLARISNSPRIIGFRNVIAHGYDVVDVEMVWEAVSDHLPVLVTEVDQLLRESLS